MKKKLAILLALTLIISAFAMTACGSKDKDNTEEPNTEATDNADVTDNADADAEGEAEDTAASDTTETTDATDEGVVENAYITYTCPEGWDDKSEYIDEVKLWQTNENGINRDYIVIEFPPVSADFDDYVASLYDDASAEYADTESSAGPDYTFAGITYKSVELTLMDEPCVYLLTQTPDGTIMQILITLLGVDNPDVKSVLESIAFR
jgi:hypothetical protein